MNSSQKIVFFSSLTSCFIMDKLTYSPYGEFSHLLSIISSFFVFIPLYSLIINKKILNFYIIVFIGMNWAFFQSPFLLKEKTSYFPRIILDEYINEIALFSCGSIILIYTGFFFFFNNVKPLTSIHAKFSNNTFRRVILFFISLSIIYRYSQITFPPYN